MSKSSWSEEEIRHLKGQEESIRFEHKAGKLFEKKDDSWLNDLSRVVSAFANTEGGDLILGLREEKEGKKRVVGDPDGIPEDRFLRDQLLQKIETSISPSLPGIRVHRVRMTSLGGRVVFVVAIPPGTTAHQAKDGRYYGRSDHGVRYLLDHDIRVRMVRGRIARASLAFRLSEIRLGATQYLELQEKYAAVVDAHAKDAQDAVTKYPDEVLTLTRARSAPDVVKFELVIKNDGELTLRDPAAEFAEACSSDSLGNVIPCTKVSRYRMVGEVVYPGDERVIPDSKLEFRLKQDQPSAPNVYVCGWRVYLDNAPPSSGNLDLGEFLRAEREKAANDAAAL